MISVLTLGFWFCAFQGLSSKGEKDSSKVLHIYSENKLIFFILTTKYLGIKHWNFVGPFFYYLHQEKAKTEVHQSMAILSQVTTST